MGIFINSAVTVNLFYFFDLIYLIICILNTDGNMILMILLIVYIFKPAMNIYLAHLAGAGHWLVAYRKAQDQKYMDVHRRIKEHYEKCESSRGVDTSHGNTLDGSFLVSH